LPDVDALAEEYSDRIDFVAPAWKGSSQATLAAANTYLPSGHVMWGLDEDEDIFQKYGIPYQPVTILIASDQTVVADWAGLKSEEELRNILEMLIDINT
jgi:hypothetical protein